MHDDIAAETCTETENGRRDSIQGNPDETPDPR
jgi:hypothetical protein